MESPSAPTISAKPADESNDKIEQKVIAMQKPIEKIESEALSPKEAKAEEPSDDQSKIDQMAEEHPLQNAPDNVYCDEAEEAEDEEPKEPETVHSDPIPNRVIVARNHPLSYYADRARRILRMEQELFVLGRGNTISMACTLVEVLKRQKIAVVEKLSTGMYVEPFFNSVGDPQWSQPTSMITFRLKRGEFAEYVIGYHQRKVVEIFEKYDPEHTGQLTADAVEKLEMAQNFHSGPELIEAAKAFLAKEAKAASGSIDLPTFIKYASILIHPLLRDKIFKNVLTEKYGIVQSIDGSQMNSPLNSP